MLCFIDLETTGLTAAEDKILEVACIVTDDKLVEVARFERVLYWKMSEKIVGAAIAPRAVGTTGSALWNEKFPDEIIDDVQAAKCPVVYVTQDEYTQAFNRRMGDASADTIVQYLARHGITLKTFPVDPFVIQMHRDNKLWKESIYGQARSTVDRDLAEFIAAYAGEKPVLAGSTVSFDRTFLAVHLPRAHALLHYRNLDVTSMNEMAKRFWPEIHAARPSDNADPDRAHRAMPDIEQSLWTARYYAAKLTTPIERGGASSRVTQVLATLQSRTCPRSRTTGSR